MRSIIAASTCIAALAGAAQAEVAEAVQSEECPPAFQGAKVTATKLPGGVSLEFKASHRALIPLLRGELREVAQLIEEHSTQTQTTGADDEQVDFPPVDLTVKDIALGARVIVRAGRFGDIPALRELAFGFAEFWKTSACSAPIISTSARP
jgi:hypothetical protein